MFPILVAVAFVTWVAFWAGLAMTPPDQRHPRARLASTWRRVYNGLPSLPLIWMAAFLLLVVRARLKFGAWPFSGSQSAAEAAGDEQLMMAYPSPAEMPMHAFLVTLLTFPVLTSVIWYPPLFAYLRRKVARLEWRGPFLFAVGYLAFVSYYVVDPGGYCAWFMASVFS